MHAEQLKYFVLVNEMGSFSAAAKLVPMSPQGLTKSIRALEAELGVELFSVDRAGVPTPNAYGVALLDFARKFEKDRSELSEAFDRIKASERHEIRLGSSLGIFGLLGPEFLDRFHRKHPDITIIFNEDTDLVCDAHLAHGAYDLALTLAPFNREFETRELYATRIGFWIPVGDPLAERDSVGVEDIVGKTVAMPGRDFKCYTNLLHACSACGTDAPEIVASSEIFWIYEFALQGKGFGFAIEPHFALPLFKASDAVKGVPLDGIAWRFGLSHMRSRELEPHERVFYDYVIAYVDKLTAQLSARSQ